MNSTFKYLFFFLLTVSSAFASKTNMLPSGWRLPTKLELGDDWRKKDRNLFASIVGNFDDDKIPDEAKILVSTDNKKIGIFIWWGKDKSGKPVEVFNESEISQIHSMGIENFSSGNYQTACGKGYFDCKIGETKNIKIDHDSINYFKTESANSVFSFDKSKKLFKRTWLSD
ncbi:MAG: hypothetical protein Q7U04_06730 [Bacteriovorax sp.]|nr:hypothetical protein [Bacteriovorax sp.]